MHSKGICHGDVYAHNVLADSEGNAVLCDYGEAAPLSLSCFDISTHD
jgi:serine/threonine protein kinase